jgi:hypothetical protein
MEETHAKLLQKILLSTSGMVWDIQVDWGVCRVSDHSANVYGVALGCVGFVDSMW